MKLLAIIGILACIGIASSQYYGGSCYGGSYGGSYGGGGGYYPPAGYGYGYGGCGSGYSSAPWPQPYAYPASPGYVAPTAYAYPAPNYGYGPYGGPYQYAPATATNPYGQTYGVLPYQGYPATATNPGAPLYGPFQPTATAPVAPTMAQAYNYMRWSYISNPAIPPATCAADCNAMCIALGRPSGGCKSVAAGTGTYYGYTPVTTINDCICA